MEQFSISTEPFILDPLLTQTPGPTTTLGPIRASSAISAVGCYD